MTMTDDGDDDVDADEDDDVKHDLESCHPRLLMWSGLLLIPRSTFVLTGRCWVLTFPSADRPRRCRRLALVCPGRGDGFHVYTSQNNT